MSRPAYAVLAAHYPRKPRMPTDGGIDAPTLYRNIGHPEYADNVLMQNTCAVRVSLALLGAGIHPEVYLSGSDATRRIGQRRGIISFFGLHGAGDNQGHIDLVEPAMGGGLQCAGSCYFTAREVWFWPLQ